MLKFAIIFSICSLINVILNTTKTIVMYKNEKFPSSLMNAVTFGFYTIIVVLMAGAMPLWLKVSITAITNFIGVWLSITILNKIRKDKIWKIETTIKKGGYFDFFKQDLNNFHNLHKISYSLIEIENYYIVNFYSESQNQSILIKQFINKWSGKYFVTENKGF